MPKRRWLERTYSGIPEAIILKAVYRAICILNTVSLCEVYSSHICKKSRPRCGSLNFQEIKKSDAKVVKVTQESRVYSEDREKKVEEICPGGQVQDKEIRQNGNPSSSPVPLRSIFPPPQD